MNDILKDIDKPVWSWGSTGGRYADHTERNITFKDSLISIKHNISTYPEKNDKPLYVIHISNTRILYKEAERIFKLSEL